MILAGKTAFITGASRGIGKAIALKLASAGVNIVIAAKSVTENEKLGGTIFSAAEEVTALGANALAVQCDIRDDDMVLNAVNQAVEKFDGIDIVVNNASAISLTNTGQTEMKRFDLMQDINVRGAFSVVKHCLPYLKKSMHAHILTLSPPINISRKWLGPHVAYTISKFNMSMLALGWAEEFKDIPIASNTLWPRTTIATAAVKNLLGGEALVNMSRKPEIVADAAFAILSKNPAYLSGKWFIDEDALAMDDILDYSKYAVTPGGKLYTDLFLDES